MSKPIAYSTYGLRRRIQRYITHQEVVLTIREPEMTGLPTQMGREHVARRFNGGRWVHVVYEEQSRRCWVITVWC